MSKPNIDALAEILDNFTLAELLESKGMVRWNARDVLEKYKAFLKDDHPATADEREVIEEDLIAYLDSWKGDQT